MERAAEIADSWEELSAPEILAAAQDLFGDALTIASSFGLEDVALIHMATRSARGPVDVFCLDTGVLFEETIALMQRFEAEYPIRLRRIVPRLTIAEQGEQYGDALWASDPDRCCGCARSSRSPAHLRATTPG